MRIGIQGSGLMGGKLDADALLLAVHWSCVVCAFRIARYTEPFALLMGQLAYEGDRGPAVAYRFEWFEEREAADGS